MRAGHVAGAVLSNLPGALQVHWGVVSATGSGPASVSVKLRGASSATPGVRYLAGYAPTVGDTVAVLVVPTGEGVDYLCLGKTA